MKWGGIIALLMLLGLGVWWLSASGVRSWHSYWAQRAYTQGDWQSSRVHLQALLQARPSLLEQGKAQVLLAEMALQDDQQAEAEAAIVQGVLRLRQWRHAYPQRDTAWLKRALETHVLIALRPFVGLAEDDLWLFELTLDELAPMLQDIAGLGGTRFERLSGLTAQKSPLPVWEGFVQSQALYRRLQVKPVVLPAPQAPTDQQAVRAVVQRWQQLKRSAFVDLDTEPLAQVLTGDALTETLQAVQWWQDQGDSYWRLNLESLRFLRIAYPEPTRALVVAEVREVRDNTREGVVEQTYRVEYTLVKLGNDWFISNMKVRT